MSTTRKTNPKGEHSFDIFCDGRDGCNSIFEDADDAELPPEWSMLTEVVDAKAVQNHLCKTCTGKAKGAVGLGA